MAPITTAPRRRLRLRGHDVAFTDAGAGSDGVVLVHGIGVSARYFGPLIAELSPTCRVLAPDLPGFGESGRPRHVLTIEEHADVVADLVTATGLRRPLLLGHSMGAQVVTEVAASRPGLAAAVVLVGPVTEPGRRSALRQGWRLARDARHETLKANRIMVGDWLRAGPRRYAATLPSMLGYPVEDRLRAVEVPVTVVRGAQDPVAPPEYVERLAGLSGGEAVEVEDAGHIAMWDPRAVAELCRRVRC